MKKSPKHSNDQIFRFFKLFLKRNNAYDSFVSNFSDSQIFNSFKLFEDVAPEWYILLAFRWQSTPEGVKYWDTLNDKWMLSLNLFNY